MRGSGDEMTFRAELLPAGEYLGPWPPEQAVEFLWRDGRVAEWVDVAARSVTDGRTSVPVAAAGS